MARIFWGALLLLTCAVVLAAGPAAVRRTVESSLLVTGRISVDTAGNVSGYSLHREEKLPAGVVAMVVRAWKFEPVLLAGRPVNAATDMSIRFVAKKIDADNFSVAVRSAAFGDRADKPRPGREELARRPRVERGACPSLTPPNYPERAIHVGVAANTYLLVKADRNGKALDAIAEQVNLKVVSDERTMERWRHEFGSASIRHAKKWCFAPLPEGQDANQKFQLVRVPVLYSLDGGPAAYGRWETYVPGPRQHNPWETEQEDKAFSPDALPPGGFYLATSRLRLLSELSGGG